MIDEEFSCHQIKELNHRINELKQQVDELHGFESIMLLYADKSYDELQKTYFDWCKIKSVTGMTADTYEGAMMAINTLLNLKSKGDFYNG